MEYLRSLKAVLGLFFIFTVQLCTWIVLDTGNRSFNLTTTSNPPFFSCKSWPFFPLLSAFSPVTRATTASTTITLRECGRIDTSYFYLACAQIVLFLEVRSYTNRIIRQTSEHQPSGGSHDGVVLYTATVHRAVEDVKEEGGRSEAGCLLYVFLFFFRFRFSQLVPLHLA